MASQTGLDRDQPGRVVRRLTANTLSLAAADVANKVMMFAYYVIAARHLGIAQYGILSFALAFVTMLAVFTDLGLGSVAAREIARDRSTAGPMTATALAIKLTAAVIVIAAIAVLVNLLGYPARTVRVVYVCAIFVIETAMTGYFMNVFQGLEKMHFSALCRVVQTAVLVVGVLLLSRGPAIVERYAWLYVVAGLVSVLLSGLCTWVFLFRFRLNFDLRDWRSALGKALPVGVAMVLVPVYYWNGTTLLSKLSGDEAVGAYSAALRLVIGAIFVGMSFSAALYPLLSRLHVTDASRLRLVLELAIRYVLLLVLPIGVLGVVLAKPVVMLVYGIQYTAAVAVLRVLVWWGGAASISSLLSNYFIAIDRPGVMTKQAVLSLAVNVAGNLILIPTKGAVGAAIAIVAAELAGVIYLWVNQTRAQHAVAIARLAPFLLRGCASLTPAAIVAWYLGRLSVWAAVPASLATYIGGLVAFGGLRQIDFSILRMLLARKASA